MLKRNHLKKNIVAFLASFAGGIAALAMASGLTIFISLIICLGFHPEVAMTAEYMAAVMGLVWAGALVARAGIGASFGTGVWIGLSWAIMWFFLMGRFNTHLWLTEAIPSLTWLHLLAWLSAPFLSVSGGFLRLRLRWFSGFLLHIFPFAAVFMAVLVNLFFVDMPGQYKIAKGIDLKIFKPDRESTTVRLFTIDFAVNPKLTAGIYDQDMHDHTPFNDRNSTYLGNPSPSVFERLGKDTLFLVNAGFFTWDNNRIISHVAPVVVNGRAYYNFPYNPDVWTFGWKNNNGISEFRLLQGIPFRKLTNEFDYAFGLARPLIVNSKPLVLKPGPGVTNLKCSRVSIAWADPHQLQILVVRDPDGEMASIAKWKHKEKQVGGWDLAQLQQFWVRRGMKNALILDSGDSTELVYKGPHGTSAVYSARFSKTLTYLRNRPLRIWIPVLPARHNNTGVCNYIYVRQ